MMQEQTVTQQTKQWYESEEEDEGSEGYDEFIDNLEIKNLEKTILNYKEELKRLRSFNSTKYNDLDICERFFIVEEKIEELSKRLSELSPQSN